MDQQGSPCAAHGIPRTSSEVRDRGTEVHDTATWTMVRGLYMDIHTAPGGRSGQRARARRQSTARGRCPFAQTGRGQWAVPGCTRAR